MLPRTTIYSIEIGRGTKKTPYKQHTTSGSTCPGILTTEIGLALWLWYILNRTFCCLDVLIKYIPCWIGLFSIVPAIRWVYFKYE